MTLEERGTTLRSMDSGLCCSLCLDLNHVTYDFPLTNAALREQCIQSRDENFRRVAEQALLPRRRQPHTTPATPITSTQLPPPVSQFPPPSTNQENE